ncbi:DUF2637 domain-containing protein [Kitasatospora sp. GAS1066B]|uniref:DUF2637 domain-containing protein n=1 Tax=Kitasatospora sp. GAS1066B TaxID=3156271 RepID=UPI003514F7AE
MARPSLTRAHRALLGVVAVGACLISGIGFAGSYSAVRELALHKGFGNFSYAFPIGVDAGIVVLLALDLVLTWLRIPFPLLRQAAWLLTVATIAFNAAASWGDPLGMGMHAVIPLLFVVVVEASRHAVGRIAAITADRHMESVRLMRWLLSPVPTFRLWRRMKLWELRSYDEVVRLEQNRLVYRAQLRFRYGRGWRRSAPIQALLPLKLAKYGVPLDMTLLERIDPPAAVEAPVASEVAEASTVSAAVAVPALARLAAARWRDGQGGPEEQAEAPARPARPVTALRDIRAEVGQQPRQQSAVPQQAAPAQASAQASLQADVEPPVAADSARQVGQQSPWFRTPRPTTAQQPAQLTRPVQQGVEAPSDGRLNVTPVPAPQPQPVAQPEPEPVLAESPVEEIPAPVAVPPQPAMDNLFAPRPRASNRPAAPTSAQAQAPFQEPVQDLAVQEAPEEPEFFESRQLTVDLAIDALLAYKDSQGHDPDEEALADFLFTQYGVSGKQPGVPASQSEIRRIWPKLRDRYATLGRE